MSMNELSALFSFIGGLGMFLFGMHIMSDGLQKSAGEKSRRFMSILADSRLLGVIVGALITAIVQSSSLTTVMAVGFVNAGMMTLTQAVGIIMGANIGTTLTAWLVSMNEWGSALRPQFFAPLLLGIGVALLLTGFLLFWSDRMAKGKKTAKSATMLDALLVGVGQAIAVVPGLSRSGTTISAGLMRGFSRKFAVRFSFLMSIPAVLGANILSIAEAVQEGIDTSLLPAYLIGTAVAAVSGYFAIGLVNLLTNKGKFGNFAYYCWGIGAAAVVASLIFHG